MNLVVQVSVKNELVMSTNDQTKTAMMHTNMKLKLKTTSGWRRKRERWKKLEVKEVEAGN